jgi:hypothetical protein
MAIVAGISIPMVGNAVGYFRLSGNARSLSDEIAVTKMRAAADFSQVRLYVDLTANSYHLETWNKTTSLWGTEGGTTYLSSNVAFGSGPISNPPPNTQGALGQASACKNNAGTDIGSTACVIFNSRGIPVDTSGKPTGGYALYLTDGTAVYGITISATGMARTWQAQPQTTASWMMQ